MPHQVKPRSQDNVAKIEAIRQSLGKSQSEFSRLLGFATDGGYSASIKHEVTDQLLLAAEGLLAKIKPNGQAKPRQHLLITLDEHSAIESSQVIVFRRQIVLDGEVFWLVPRQEPGEPSQ